MDKRALQKKIAQQKQPVVNSDVSILESNSLTMKINTSKPVAATRGAPRSVHVSAPRGAYKGVPQIMYFPVEEYLTFITALHADDN
jgi:hypothetical protein